MTLFSGLRRRWARRNGCWRMTGRSTRTRSWRRAGRRARSRNVSCGRDSPSWRWPSRISDGATPPEPRVWRRGRRPGSRPM